MGLTGINTIFSAEDYELVFSLPRKWAKNLLDQNKNFTEIGVFSEGEIKIEFKNYNSNKLLEYKPFTHF